MVKGKKKESNSYYSVHAMSGKAQAPEDNIISEAGLPPAGGTKACLAVRIGPKIGRPKKPQSTRTKIMVKKARNKLYGRIRK